MAFNISRRGVVGGALMALSTRALAQPAGSGLGVSATSLGFSSPGTVGFPSLLRGSLDGTTYFTKTGGVLGSGQTTGQRQTNATQLQAAINAAISGNKFFELEEGVYEINSSTGLSIPAQGFGAAGFVWRGARGGTLITQFYTGGSGAPVLTIGDVTGATEFAGLDFDGVTVTYGTAMTSLTAAQTLRIGAAAWGRITGLVVGAGGATYPGYDGVYIYNGSTQNFFSNTCADWQINGCQHTLFNAPNAMGTGNNFFNIYLNNGGSGVYNAFSGNYLTLGTSIGTETTFVQLNCEWGAGNIVLDVEGAIGITFEGLHMEGLKLTGFNPTFVSCANSKIAITSFEIDNCVIQSGNITGVAKVFRDYAPQGSNITVENLNFVNFASGNVTASIVVMSPDAPATDFGAYSIRGMSWTDQSGTNIWAGNVSLDSHQPTSSSQFLTPEHVGNYQYGVSGSLTDAAVIFVSSTYNHYGQLRAATLFVPASITSFVLTLMATMGATGTQPPPTGAICTVIRESGTASGTLTVKDDAGTTLTTNTTSATSYTYMFNGTHFIAITPVT